MERKKCPYCGELIAAKAKKCRFCGEWLMEQPTAPAVADQVEQTASVVESQPVQTPVTQQVNSVQNTKPKMEENDATAFEAPFSGIINTLGMLGGIMSAVSFIHFSETGSKSILQNLPFYLDEIGGILMSAAAIGILYYVSKKLQWLNHINNIFLFYIAMFIEMIYVITSFITIASFDEYTDMDDIGIEEVLIAIGEIIIYVAIGRKLTSINVNKVTTKLGRGFIAYPVCLLLSVVCLGVIDNPSNHTIKYISLLAVAGWFYLIDKFNNYISD